MDVKWSDPLHSIDIVGGPLLDLLLSLPKVLIFCELTSIDCHLDDLTVGLEPLEHIYVDVPTIVHILVVLVQLLTFPLSEQDLVAQCLRGRHTVELLLDGSPRVLW